MTEVEEKRERDHLERRRQHQRITNAYHRVFRNSDGKTVLDDLVASFGINIPAFLTTSTRAGESISYDPIYAAIRDGQRSVYLHISAKLDIPVIGDANLEPQPHVITE
jgi:hypothetical protein